MEGDQPQGDRINFPIRLYYMKEKESLKKIKPDFQDKIGQFLPFSKGYNVRDLVNEMGLYIKITECNKQLGGINLKSFGQLQILPTAYIFRHVAYGKPSF